MTNIKAKLKEIRKRWNTYDEKEIILLTVLSVGVGMITGARLKRKSIIAPKDIQASIENIPFNSIPKYLKQIKHDFPGASAALVDVIITF